MLPGTRKWRQAALTIAIAIAATLCARQPARAAEQGQLCRQAVKAAEAGSGLPPHLLAGIARVESGRRDPVTGRFSPWPWSINSGGQDFLFDSKAEAIAYARQLQARGVRSMDVGCLQVNLMYHPQAFQSLEEAFDPIANARYAVKFLTDLHQQTGSWDTASAWYHSANPQEGTPYRGKVIRAMAEEAQTAGTEPDLQQAQAAPQVSAVRSMPNRVAQAIMLQGGTSGAILAQRTLPTGGTVPGRGLDAYRMRPVLVASRAAMGQH